ncbi:chorismate mutase [Streptomyces sp. NRRL WC-3742]|uniref:chorismate mutase n=1 Tax=Streptomyces sp. NRRL WC-3742 TaxID=1463934 RepID=UPI000689E388|nr:chorismate mutase [Streptomyces sp. NRRL WC-3742]
MNTGSGTEANRNRDEIDWLRGRIDAVDSTVIDLLRRRRELSAQVQGLRTGEGGDRIDPGREEFVRNRYREALGDGGTDLAATVLRLCRGSAGGRDD